MKVVGNNSFKLISHNNKIFSEQLMPFHVVNFNEMV